MSTLFRLVAPSDDLDWQIDLTDDLGSDDVASAVWSLDPDDSPSMLHDGTTAAKTATIWAGPGFAPGVVYVLSAVITTDAGRDFERSITLRCEDNR